MAEPPRKPDICFFIFEEFYRFKNAVALALYLFPFLTEESFYVFFIIEADNMKH